MQRLSDCYACNDYHTDAHKPSYVQCLCQSKLFISGLLEYLTVLLEYIYLHQK